MGIRHRALQLGAPLVALVLAFGSVPATSAAPPAAAAPGFHYAGAHVPVAKSAAGAAQARQHLAPLGRGGRRLALAPETAARAADAPVTVGSTPGLQSSQGFAGVTDATSYCPTRPCYEPPDPWVAAGPSHVVQATNDGIRVTDRSGTLLHDYYLWDFFGETASSVIDGDPHLVWDSLHARWLATELSADCSTGYWYLAVSRTADPSAAWDVYYYSFAGQVPDYPGLGFSSDKVALSYNLFGLNGCTASGPSTSGFQGAGVFEVDAAGLLARASDANATLYHHVFDASLSRFTYRLAASQTPTNTLNWVAGGDNGTTDSLDVVVGTIDGTAQSGLGMTEQDLSQTGSPVLPPFQRAPQPSQPGSPSTIADAADERPTDAVFASGNLWFVSTGSCTPEGSATAAACVRVTATGSRPQDFSLGTAGMSTFMGGLGLAGDGTAYVVYSQSSPSRYVSTYAAYQSPSDPANSLHPAALLRAGEATYPGQRWGDYVGVALDPVDGGAVWQADEYPDGGGGWSTWVSRLNLAAGAPSGAIAINGGAATTASASVSLKLTPTGGAGVSQVLVSNSPTVSGGRLSLARSLPAGGTLDWSLTETATGGTATAGTKTVYVQWGDGGSVWSGVTSATIGYAPGTVVRLAGPSRFDTAAAIAKATFKPGVEIAYIAYAYNFPDALAGAAAAGTYKGPVLLVSTLGPINPATIDALKTLKPRLIAVLGSTSVVSDEVKSALAQFATSGVVTRLAGASRFQTAAVIAKAIFRPGVRVAYIAYAYNFPDALAGAAAAGTVQGPVLLVNTSGQVDPNTLDALTTLKPQTIAVLGSSGVVSDTVMNSLKPYATSGSVSRLSGAGRFATAARIATATFSAPVDVAYIAYAYNFPDALAGAAAAGTVKGPVLLVSTAGPIDVNTAAALTTLRPKKIVVLGSASVVSDYVLSQLAQFVH